MVWSILRWARRDLRSRMSGFFMILLVSFSLLMVLAQRRTTWKKKSLCQYAPGSRVSREFRKLRIEERITWDRLHYIHDPSKKKSVIWCKVPKAGSTTLAKMFVRLADERKAKVAESAHHVLDRLYPRPLPEVMASRFNTTFKFLVARHPFERILSAYRDKFERLNWYIETSTNGTLMVKQPGPHEAVVHSTFPEFVTYLLETDPERYNRHWMPTSRLCAPCIIRYDLIVNMDNFRMEIKVPLRLLGIYEGVRWDYSTGTNSTTVERYFQQLSFTQLEQLYYKYLEDFLLFGFTPNKYFSMVSQKTAT